MIPVNVTLKNRLFQCLILNTNGSLRNCNGLSRPVLMALYLCRPHAISTGEFCVIQRLVVFLSRVWVEY
jgi:hypothetical protein